MDSMYEDTPGKDSISTNGRRPKQERPAKAVSGGSAAPDAAVAGLASQWIRSLRELHFRVASG
jgi:hypothetical protein